MKVVLPIGRGYVRVGWFGLLMMLPVYGLWIACLAVWVCVLGAVVILRVAAEMFLGIKSKKKESR